MKKISTLVLLLCVTWSVFAQHSTTTSHNPITIPDNATHPVTSRFTPAKLNEPRTTARRTTSSTTYRNWFSYFDQNYTTSSHLYYSVIYPDSNLVVPATSSSSAFNVYCHGQGMSFDPTDGGYYGVYGTSTVVPITDPIITHTQGYSIDSFAVPLRYIMNDYSSGVDSLIIELFAVSQTGGPDSGTYQLRYPAFSVFIPVTSDSTPRFATAIYTRQASGLGVNEVWDSIKSFKQRYAFPLSAIDTGRDTVFTFGLSTPLLIQPGRKAVSFVHLKSAHSYTLGTSINAANYLRLFSGTTEAGIYDFPQQTAHNAFGVPAGYPGSYQTGLVATKFNRYDGNSYTYSAHNVLIPGVEFVRPDFSVTYQAFHVVWDVATPSAITGTTTVCLFAIDTLFDSVSGGTWSSSNPSVAAINSTSGIYAGFSPGTATITYTLGSTIVTTSVTVLSTPATPYISGPSSVCIGSAISLSSASAGGVWSTSSSSVASVSATGTVTGVSTGTAYITYTVTNICGSAYDVRYVTITSGPSAGTITGPSSVCEGNSTTLVDGVSGGTWSSSSTLVATVSSTGVVTGIAAGTTIITYAITSGGCTGYATYTFTVTPPPSAGTIMGIDSACPGYTAALSSAVSGGTWSSANTAIATVSSAGVVTGVALGTTPISYAVNTGGCFGYSSINFRVSCTSGVENVNAGSERINIFPNPNAGSFNVLLSSAINQQANVVISNVTGQVVKEFTVATNKQSTIQLNEPSGIYLISVTLANGRYVERITIAK